MSRVNEDLKKVMDSYMLKIVRDWVDNSEVDIVIDSGNKVADSKFVRWIDESEGKVVVVASLEDTVGLDKSLIEGMKVGSLEYLSDRSMEIEGGYSYSILLELYVSKVSE